MNILRKLELHSTKNKETKETNGKLIPIYRDWEQSQTAPQMCYLTTCLPFDIKGPHHHIERENNFTCIKGKVAFIAKIDNSYQEFILSEDAPASLKIAPNVPCAHINIGVEEAFILNLCSPAWHPDNQDDHPVEFNDYHWSKWTSTFEETLRANEKILCKEKIDELKLKIFKMKEVFKNLEK